MNTRFPLVLFCLYCTVAPIYSSIPIIPDGYYKLKTVQEALSVHKVCTKDEETCVSQHRVVAMLLVKDMEKDPAVKAFGQISKFFPKGSLSFFVTDSREVQLNYVSVTGGRGPTIVVVNPYNLDGTKKRGSPRISALPTDITVDMHHNVTEWLIRQTLAHVERFPGDGGTSTKARQLLFQACNWPKVTIFSATNTIPEDLDDAIESRLDRLVVALFHVKKKSDLKLGFKEKDFDPVWDQIQHGYYLLALKDPVSGVSQRVATQAHKFPVVIDQFFVDIRTSAEVKAKARAQINGKDVPNLADEMDKQEKEKAKQERMRKLAEKKAKKEKAKKKPKKKKKTKKSADADADAKKKKDSGTKDEL
eukprot:m.175294 g.175294  ORF g.175294 m.175294 type:complete len:362 (-) comp15422_c0_seq2:39-1124(-)